MHTSIDFFLSEQSPNSFFHRLGDNLRAEQAHAVASRTQADGSGAAVKVEQHVAGRGRGVGGRLRVKAFGHLGVDLIKGQRTDGKDPAAERVGQAVLAPQLDAGAAENDVRPLGVDVQPYAFDGGTARRQFVGEAVEGLRVAVTTSTTQSSPLRDARRKMWRSSPLPVVSS